MDRYIDLETRLRLGHQHGDGSWHPLRPHHDVSEHDPERDWSKPVRFECATCPMSVSVNPDHLDHVADETAG
jgi:hypothetical protein